MLPSIVLMISRIFLRMPLRETAARRARLSLERLSSEAAVLERPPVRVSLTGGGLYLADELVQSGSHFVEPGGLKQQLIFGDAKVHQLLEY